MAQTKIGTAGTTQVTVPPFQRLIDAHAQAVAGFLRGMLRPADAEDALQETFLSALRAYDRFDGRNPRAWLLTIARNKAIDATRAEGKRGTAGGVDPDELAGPQAPDDLREVWVAVAELPTKQREAIVLRFAGDLAYREIGIAMETTEAAARRNVHEAISKLRNASEIQEVRTK